MDVLNNLYLTDMMHTISEALIVPVVVTLMLLVLYSVYSVGSVLVEVFVERHRYNAQIPKLVALLDAAEPGDLDRVIDESGLLTWQKDDLCELVSYLYLPEDARTEVAKRLLANEQGHYQKTLGHTDAAAKISPMLGLMGTLIPLGPGIVALGAGDLDTLSSALLVAFDTTVAGLACAVVCYLISRMRRRWYDDYLVSMEAAFNTLLEKGREMHERKIELERTVYEYDDAGKRAQLKKLDDFFGGSLGKREAAASAVESSAGLGPAPVDALAAEPIAEGREA